MPVESRHAGRRELTRYPHFREKPLTPHRIGSERPRKKLKRDRLPKLEVVGTIDFAHATAPEQPYDAVTIRDNSAWSESTSGNRIRRNVPGSSKSGYGGR